jgi:hypothetical protein
MSNLCQSCRSRTLELDVNIELMGKRSELRGAEDHWFPQIAFSPPHLGLLTAWFVDAVMGSRPPPFLRILPLPLTWGRYLINRRVFHVTVPY